MIKTKIKRKIITFKYLFTSTIIFDYFKLLFKQLLTTKRFLFKFMLLNASLFGICYLLYPLAGIPIGSVLLIPVIIAAWFLGPITGFLAGFLNSTIGLWVLFLASENDTAAFQQITIFTIFFMYCIVGWLIGWLQHSKNDRLLLVASNNRSLRIIKDNTEQYKNLFNEAPAAIFELNYAKLKIINANQLLCDYTGYSKAELQSISFLDLLGDECIEPFFERLQKIIQGKAVPQKYEYRLLLKNGHAKYFSFHSRDVLNNGQTTGARIIALDITEQKQTEKLLHIQSDIIRSLSKTSNLNEALTLLLEKTLIIEGIDAGEIYLLDQNTHNLTRNVYSGLSEKFIKMLKNSNTHEEYMDKLSEEKSYFYASTEMSTRLRTLLEMEKLKSLAILPVIYEKKIIASLHFMSSSYSELPRLIKHTLETISAQFADVLVRLKTSTALQESEQNYRILTDNIIDNIWILDLTTFNFEYISPSVETIRGYTPEEALALSLEQSVTATSFSKIKQIVKEELLKDDADLYLVDQVRNIEMELIHKNGSIIWTEVTSRFLRNDAGYPVRLLGITRDISERRESLEKLKNISKEWEQTFNSISDMVAIIDMNHKFIRVNKAYATKYKLHPDSFIGKHCYKIAHETHEPLHDCPFKLVQETKKPSSFETFDAVTNQHFEVSVFPILDENKEMTHVVHITKDISSRKELTLAVEENEEQFRALVEDAPYGISIMNPDYTFEYINPKFTELFGYSIKEIPSKTEWLKLAFPDANYREEITESLSNNLEPVKDNSKELTSNIFHINCASGAKKYIHVNSVIMLNGKQLLTYYDITERYLSEIELQHTKNRFQDIVLSSGDWIWEIDHNNIFTYASGKVLQILGYAPEEIIGKHFYDFLSDYNRFDVQDYLELYIAQKIPIIDLETWKITKKGDKICTLTSAVPITDKLGELIGYRGVDKNITDRKQSEELLHIQRDIGISLSTVTTITDACQSLLTLIIHIDAIDCGEVYLIDEHSEEFKLVAHTGLSSVYVQNSETIQVRSSQAHIINDRKPFYGVHSKFITNSNQHLKRERLLGLACLPIFSEEKIIGCLVVSSHTQNEIPKKSRHTIEAISSQLGHIISRFQAVNFLRDSEERYRLISENTDDLISILSLADNFTYTYVSPSHKKIMTYDPEDILGTPGLDYIHPEDKELLQPLLMKYKQSTTGADRNGFPVSQSIEYRMKDKFESWHNIESTVNFVGGDKLLMISRDVTGRLKMDQVLREAEIAEKSNKAKSEFLANMSHEIRTPLNAIIGISNLMLDTKINQEQAEFLGTINNSSNSLLNIVNEILDLSKIESEQLVLENIPFDINACIKEIVTLFKVKAQEKNIKLIHKIGRTVPQVIIGDPFRLRQIIMNLVSNAIKFTSKGKVLLSISLEKKITDHTFINFSVVDSGIGIPRDRMSALFKPFSQIDASMSRKYGGTGLGLVISQRLAELMGGSISVDSTHGKGSTFSFTIVAKKSSIDKLEKGIQVANTKVSFNENPAAINKDEVTILLAEDNITNQQVACYMLSKLGYQVDVVNNGLEASNIFKEKSYSLILMDVQMPEMDGLQATDSIRKHEKEHKLQRTPIIAMTAHAMKGDKEQCVAAGMDDYVSKPVNIDFLDKKIIQHISLSNQDQIIESIPQISETKKTEELSSSATEVSIKPIDKNIFDKELLVERLFGDDSIDEEFIETILSTFITDFPSKIDQLSEASKNQDSEQIKNIGHQIKGQTANLSAENLRQLAVNLENAGKEEDLKSVDNFIDNLKIEFDKFKEIVDV